MTIPLYRYPLHCFVTRVTFFRFLSILTRILAYILSDTHKLFNNCHISKIIFSHVFHQTIISKMQKMITSIQSGASTHTQLQLIIPKHFRMTKINANNPMKPKLIFTFTCSKPLMLNLSLLPLLSDGT